MIALFAISAAVLGACGWAFVRWADRAIDDYFGNMSDADWHQ